MQKNLAVHTIMEAMRTAYAKSGTRPLNCLKLHKRSWKAHKYCEWKACIICKQHVSLLNRLMNLVVKVLLKFIICFSISFRWYTFPNFCTQISCPLAYGVCISSKASATADLKHNIECCCFTFRQSSSRNSGRTMITNGRGLVSWQGSC